MSETRPNILILCSDQHHPRCAGFRGHQAVRTPHLDRLARQGAHFSRAYCNSPVCGPSRMSLMTGKYVHQIRTWQNKVALDPSHTTWARRLDEAGLPTTMLGKMDFSGDYQDGGFTHHRIIRRRISDGPLPRAEPSISRIPGYRRPYKRQVVEQAGPRPEAIISDGKLTDEGKYEVGNYDHDRMVTNWAVQWLREQRSDRPWLLYVGLVMPHWPFRAPQRFFDLYDPASLEFPIDAHFPNDHLHPALRHYQQALTLDGLSEKVVRRATAAYYGMITCLDAMIGEILSELDAANLSEHTYVIYTSDHGETLGEHGLFYKYNPYEGSVGIPLIIKGPGVPAGQVIGTPVSLVDLYPTLLDLAGVSRDPDLDADRPGHSWWPLLSGQVPDRPDYAFCEFHGPFFPQPWYMLASDTYKYIHYEGQRPSLFHLPSDPDEMQDLAADPDSADRLEQFETLLRSVVDPEHTARLAKHDLGLIDSNGKDHTA